jgi:acetyltransferase-like isoleucine patch superfamily enzyme
VSRLLRNAELAARLVRSFQLQALDRVRREIIRIEWLKKGVVIDPTSLIRTDNHAQISIGEGTSIGAFNVIDLLSDPNAPSTSYSELTIGRDVAINEFNNIRVSGGSISIGDGTLISQRVSIIGTNHALARGAAIRDQPWDLSRRTTVIGEDVWLAAHVIVLPGVHIGRGTVVGAGSVVTKDLPKFCIAVGVPARVIRARD